MCRIGDVRHGTAHRLAREASVKAPTVGERDRCTFRAVIELPKRVWVSSLTRPVGFMNVVHPADGISTEMQRGIDINGIYRILGRSLLRVLVYVNL